MRNFTAMMVAMMFVVFGASFTFAADDVTIDNRNNNDNSNTNTATSDASSSSDQDQNQKQRQEQDAHSSAIVTSPRELLGLPTAPNLMSVTVVPEAKGCFPISS